MNNKWELLLKFSGLLLMILSLIVVPGWALEGGAIKGKVVNNKGKGVSGATVTADREGEVVTVRTNDKGEFQLDNLATGEYLLSVEASGYKSAQLVRKQKVEAGKTTKLSGEVILEIASSMTLLRGAVFDDRGFSLPGAKVVLELVKGEKFKKEYLTNNAGEFAFRLPDIDGDYRVTVTAANFAVATKEVTINKGEARNLAISLSK